MRKMTPASIKQVTINKGFWSSRLRWNREHTLPHAYRQLEEVGSLDAFEGFSRNIKPETNLPYRDSDVAKWIEAASYSLMNATDPQLEETLESVVRLVVNAQCPDGYLNTRFGHRDPGKRWSNLRDGHELYCAGHLMEAAVAHHEATGSRTLLDAMCRYADYIGSVFGDNEGQKRGYPGHEEIELALIKLARATGRKRYLDLARFFIDERGRKPHYFDLEAQERGEEPDSKHPHRQAGEKYSYYQAHRPVREQKTAEGHAVRATYLYAGMADVAVETGDGELMKSCRRLWRNIVGKRMYVTGGIGSDPLGERFSFDYDLPNYSAYAETCAAIGLVFFAHRMLQMEPRRSYADVIERALYNNILACSSLDGRRFFYANRLACDPAETNYREHQKGWHSAGRQPWYGTACCPTNLCRFLPGLGQYIYSGEKRKLWVHQYVNSTYETSMLGEIVNLTQESHYPLEGQIGIEVQTDISEAFTICLRVPGWCDRAEIKVGGGAFEPACADEDGYVKITRSWKGTTELELKLDLSVKRVRANPAVRYNAGRVALQRGPIVFCLEEVDNGRNLSEVLLPRESDITVSYGDSELGAGVPVLTADGLRRDPEQWEGRLYSSAYPTFIKQQIRAVPYYLWNNRGVGEMTVWIKDGTPYTNERYKTK
ncbi:MAG: glycoside hydrolase family 127 protein [Candidatus Brocadiia bacterium]